MFLEAIKRNLRSLRSSKAFSELRKIYSVTHSAENYVKFCRAHPSRRSNGFVLSSPMLFPFFYRKKQIGDEKVSSWGRIPAGLDGNELEKRGDAFYHKNPRIKNIGCDRDHAPHWVLSASGVYSLENHWSKLLPVHPGSQGPAKSIHSNYISNYFLKNFCLCVWRRPPHDLSMSRIPIIRGKSSETGANHQSNVSTGSIKWFCLLQKETILSKAYDRRTDHFAFRTNNRSAADRRNTSESRIPMAGT